MFLGEMLCMVAFWISACWRRRRPEGSPYADIGGEEAPRAFSPLVFLPPALCDMTATSVQYIGLTLTYASSFQVQWRHEESSSIISFITTPSDAAWCRDHIHRHTLHHLSASTPRLVQMVRHGLRNWRASHCWPFRYAQPETKVPSWDKLNNPRTSQSRLCPCLVTCLFHLQQCVQSRQLFQPAQRLAGWYSHLWVTGNLAAGGNNNIVNLSSSRW